MLTLQSLPNVLLHDNITYNLLKKFGMIDFVNFIHWWPFQSYLFRLFRRSSIKYGALEVAIGFASAVLQISDITRTFNSAIPLFCIKLQEYKTGYSGFSSKFHIIHICHKDKSDFFNVWFLWLNADINPSLELFVLTYTNSSTPFVFRVSNETFRTHSRKLWDTCPV